MSIYLKIMVTKKTCNMTKELVNSLLLLCLTGLRDHRIMQSQKLFYFQSDKLHREQIQFVRTVRETG